MGGKDQECQVLCPFWGRGGVVIQPPGEGGERVKSKGSGGTVIQPQGEGGRERRGEVAGGTVIRPLGEGELVL